MDNPTTRAKVSYLFGAGCVLARLAATLPCTRVDGSSLTGHRLSTDVQARAIQHMKNEGWEGM